MAVSGSINAGLFRVSMQVIYASSEQLCVRACIEYGLPVLAS